MSIIPPSHCITRHAPVADVVVTSSSYSTNEATDSILTADYETLSNNEKGFKFEIEVQNVLDNLHLDFSGNPNIWNNWIKEQGLSEGYDIKLDFNNLRIECKYISVTPYHNSFLRDWYARDCDVIVTSNKDLVSIQDKELLKSKGVKLLSVWELSTYLRKLLCPTIVNVLNNYSISDFNSKEQTKAEEKGQTKDYKEKFKSKIKKLMQFVYEGYGRFREGLTKKSDQSEINKQTLNNNARRLEKHNQESNKICCLGDTKQCCSSHKKKKAKKKELTDYNLEYCYPQIHHRAVKMIEWYNFVIKLLKD